jgi:hypothetical protein
MIVMVSNSDYQLLYVLNSMVSKYPSLQKLASFWMQFEFEANFVFVKQRQKEKFCLLRKVRLRGVVSTFSQYCVM